MKIICIITARSKSSEIKNKNIKYFGGKPLIFYSIKFAKKLKFVNKIIFSTDSKKYISIAKRYFPFESHLRPKELAKKYSKSIDVIKYEINRLKKKKENFDYVLILEPTSPFRNIKDFNNAYKLISKKNYDTVITIKKSKNIPEQMFINNGKKLKPFMYKTANEILKPRQKFKNKFLPAGSMYLTSIKNIEKNKILGNKIYGIPVSKRYALNIDDEEDLILANNYFL